MKPQPQRRHKRLVVGFVVLALVALAINIVQQVKATRQSAALLSEVDGIQRNTEHPPPVNVNIPPAAPPSVFIYPAASTPTMPSRPDLHPKIGLTITSSVGKEKRDTFVIMDFNVVNRGLPVTVSQVQLSLSVSGHSYQPEYPIIPDPKSTTTIGKAGVLSGSDYWSNKIAYGAIPTNIAVGVWVSARFPGVSSEEIASKGGTFTLTCKDALGRRSSDSYVIARNAPSVRDMTDLATQQ